MAAYQIVEGIETYETYESIQWTDVLGMHFLDVIQYFCRIAVHYYVLKTECHGAGKAMKHTPLHRSHPHLQLAYRKHHNKSNTENNFEDVINDSVFIYTLFVYLSTFEPE